MVLALGGAHLYSIMGKVTITELIISGFGLFVALMIITHMCLRYRHKKHLRLLRESVDGENRERAPRCRRDILQ